MEKETLCGVLRLASPVCGQQNATTAHSAHAPASPRPYNPPESCAVQASPATGTPHPSLPPLPAPPLVPGTLHMAASGGPCAPEAHGAPAAPSPAPPPPPSQGRRKPGRPAQWSGCQVCGADVSGCRFFHQRYHICERHMAAESVLRDGVPHRFCQQCGRFHLLDKFAPGMHSCREQLARHAERRRRVRALAAAAAGKAGGQRHTTPAPPGTNPATVGAAAPEAAAAAYISKRPHLALSEPSASQPPSPRSSPECKEAPLRPRGGSSGSSASTHSAHLGPGAGADAEQALQRDPAEEQGSPSTSCDGMDALLAAAAEEEEAEAAAAKRPRHDTNMHAHAYAQPAEQSAMLSMEPDITWFAAPTGAATAAASHLATSDGYMLPLRQPSAQPSAVLPLPVHILSALPPEASAVLPPPPAPARPPLPPQHRSVTVAAPSSPNAPPTAAPPPVPNVALLLQHLLASHATQAAPGLLPAVPVQLAPALPDAVLSQVLAALQLAAAQQAVQLQQAQWAAQVQQLVLLAREREQLQQEQRVACLFKAAVEGLMSTVLALHSQQAV
ncbi:hypothetical protein ABPG75_007135 [Micractinium tetrahymenae]